MRRAPLVVFALAVMGACGEDKPALPPVTTTVSTTTTTAQVGVDPSAYVESGDYVNGRHIALIKAFDEEYVGFDVVQFLTGDAARQAYAEDVGGDGPDNDHYIRNQNDQVRTLPLGDDLVIRVNNAGGYAPSEPNTGHEVNWATFDSYMRSGSAAGYFWLTIKAGRVAAIEEQYIP